MIEHEIYEFQPFCHGCMYEPENFWCLVAGQQPYA
jgi:hypothetical protein